MEKKLTDILVERNVEVIEPAAQLSYFVNLGKKIDFCGAPITTSSATDTAVVSQIQSVMHFGFAPVLGNGTNVDLLATDPLHPNAIVKDVAQALYLYVRHVNSGSKNYESADLIIYCYAVASLMLNVAFAKRLFKTAYTFADNDRTKPEALFVNVMDYEDLANDIENYRSTFNKIVGKISTLCIPKIFPFLEAQLDMVSKIYADDQSVDNAQWYSFIPAVAYTFGLDSNQAGMLTASSIGYSSSFTMGQFLSIIKAQRDALLYDEDQGTMSGDLLKAFPNDDQHYGFALLTDEDIIGGLVAEYSEEMLARIKNMTILGVDFGSHYTTSSHELPISNLNIKQINGVPAQNVRIQKKTSLSAPVEFLPKHLESSPIIYTTSEDAIDWKDTINYTVFKTRITKACREKLQVASAANVALAMRDDLTLTYGTELILFAEVITKLPNSQNYVALDYCNSMVTQVQTSDGTTVSGINQLDILESAIGMFKCHPILEKYTIWKRTSNPSDTSLFPRVYFRGIVGDVIRVAEPEIYNLTKFHDTVIDGSFGLATIKDLDKNYLAKKSNKKKEA